jgi:predicted membrane channel-forming protein YqfA (hemolysin III family)
VRKWLEYIRAAIVVTAAPAIIVFLSVTSRTWYVVLSVYVVLATLTLLVLNHVLAKEQGDQTDAPPAQPPQ